MVFQCSKFLEPLKFPNIIELSFTQYQKSVSERYNLKFQNLRIGVSMKLCHSTCKFQITRILETYQSYQFIETISSLRSQIAKNIYHF